MTIKLPLASGFVSSGAGFVWFGPVQSIFRNMLKLFEVK